MKLNKVLVIGVSSNIGKNYTLLNSSKYNCIPLSLRDNLNQMAMKGSEIDVIINFSSVNPLSSIKNYITGNAEISKKILKIANNLPCKRLINISAMSIFNGINTGVVKNTTKPMPIDEYSYSKFMMESEFIKSNLDQVINIRLPGVDIQGINTSFLSNLKNKLLNNEEIKYYNPESKFNNIINVKYIFNFIDNIISSEKKSRVFYNLGANEPIELIRMIKILKDKYQSESNLVRIESRNRNSFYIDLEKENEVLYLANLYEYL